MWTNGSPPKTTNTAPPGGLFGSQQRPDDYVGASDDDAGYTPNKDTQFGQPTNQFPPPPGYSYLPLQPPFPGAPQFYHHAPFNMTPSSQPSSGATQGVTGGVGRRWCGCCGTKLEVRIERTKIGISFSKSYYCLLYKRTSKERRKGNPPTLSTLSLYTIHLPPSNHSSCSDVPSESHPMILHTTPLFLIVTTTPPLLTSQHLNSLLYLY